MIKQEFASRIRIENSLKRAVNQICLRWPNLSIITMQNQMHGQQACASGDHDSGVASDFQEDLISVVLYQPGVDMKGPHVFKIRSKIVVPRKQGLAYSI